MSIQNQIDELILRRQLIEKGGEVGNAKTLKEGSFLARTRLIKLLDSMSFTEIGAFVKQRATDFNLDTKELSADGVVTGYGTIAGRLVYVYSQDASVVGGAIGEMHGKKIQKLYELATKTGAPIIGLLDSAGLRLQESTDALEAFGIIYQSQVKASGVIPQIVAILGSCGGGSALLPSLADFTFMTQKEAKLFVNSPNALEDPAADFEKYASAKFHSEVTGLVDFVSENETSLFESIGKLVAILPSNYTEEACLNTQTDDFNREDVNLPSVIEADGLNAKLLLTSLADGHRWIEVKGEYGKSMITGFAELGGATVGLIGNAGLMNEGRLTSAGAEKAASFVKFCDAFNIPIVTITDTAGYASSVQEESLGLSKAIAKMTSAFIQATVPKVGLVVNRAFGSAYAAFNSKHIGADIVLAWPSAQISVMDPEAAVKIIYADEIKASLSAKELIEDKTNLYAQLQASPYAAASHGYIDDIIEPAYTRKRLIYTLEMLQNKREQIIDRKHSTR